MSLRIYLISLIALTFSSAAQTAQLDVIHSFSGSDGGNLTSTLIMDKTGNLYGVADGGPKGRGVVFKIAPDGTETTVHVFYRRSQGVAPEGGLVADKQGNLYGATAGGGFKCNDERVGCGAIYKIAANGKYSELYEFNIPPDGEEPWSRLILDRDGNLYGTTLKGGKYGYGIAFKIWNSGGSNVILHSFHRDADDGATPAVGLIGDKKGNLYGTTEYGGNLGAGVVFK